MNVYVIEEGCQYEGTGIVAIYERYVDAIAAAKNVVERHVYRNYKESPITDREYSGGIVAIWQDGSDILLITRHNVIEAK